MTLSEFATMLGQTNLDVAEDEFPREFNPAYPYIIYETGESENMYADDCTYIKAMDITVSIYSKARADHNAMKALEDVFKSNSIPWKFKGTFDHEQYDYEAQYSVSVIIEDEVVENEE